MRSTRSIVLAAAAISPAFLGCEGPLTATVGRVSDSGNANMDAAVADALPDAADAPIAVDAAPVDASGGPSEAGRDPPLDGECVVLPSLLEVTFADGITVDGVSASLLPAGCSSSTADSLLTNVASFYARSDGGLLVQAGQLYSLRWPAAVSGVSYRLFGGPMACPEKELVNAQPDAGAELESGPGCQAFTALVDAVYLGFGNGALERTTLCRGPCDSLDPAKRATLSR